jgi:hypothetical protein
MTKYVSVIVLILALASAAPADMWYGPTPYLQFSDSPFSGLAFDTFYLEDFEDGLLDTPGVTASGGYLTRSNPSYVNYVDSVDGDDGLVDGSGSTGNSWFFPVGSTGLTFTSDLLPTHFGVVWTDGNGQTTFEAFDVHGVSLGTIGPVGIADSSYTGGTAEDRFFGISSPDGIWKIKITNSVAGIEVDHLQYGVVPVPVPGAVLLGLLGLGAAGAKLRKRA